MEDVLTYSSSVLKLAGNILPSDSQMNDITSILQGHTYVYDCMSPDWSRQIADLQMYPVVSYVQQRNLSLMNE